MLKPDPYEEHANDLPKGLLCSPPPFALDSDKEAYFSRLRLNYSSLHFYAQEARQNRMFVSEIEVFEQVLE